MMETVVIVLLAYLIGAVPSGYLIGRIFYGVDLKKKKIVSLASIAGAPVVPIVIWVLGEPWEYVAFSLAAALIVVVKHKENIERLLRGEEKPIIQGKKESQ